MLEGAGGNLRYLKYAKQFGNGHLLYPANCRLQQGCQSHAEGLQLCIFGSCHTTHYYVVITFLNFYCALCCVVCVWVAVCGVVRCAWWCEPIFIIPLNHGAHPPTQRPPATSQLHCSTTTWASIPQTSSLTLSSYSTSISRLCQRHRPAALSIAGVSPFGSLDLAHLFGARSGEQSHHVDSASPGTQRRLPCSALCRCP